MMVETLDGGKLDQALLRKYFKSLINSFYKILPMREKEDATLPTYMCSFRRELLGCQSLIPALADDTSYLTLLSILQYLIDNQSENVSVVKREVFRAINICSKLEVIYARGGGR